ncbi:hypothetical protein HPB50_004748 [Hyalomma asiaticum]|uniref:Uncharacterized protein n=1 Tax=Hyalomma asiaticum TaxID=266040 RepID=A0ACB7TIS1_HYAAI|nr:hypothetical protein HPB50_004748 [Hyalomma asiaticum]
MRWRTSSSKSNGEIRIRKAQAQIDQLTVDLAVKHATLKWVENDALVQERQTKDLGAKLEDGEEQLDEAKQEKQAAMRTIWMFAERFEEAVV